MTAPTSGPIDLSANVALVTGASRGIGKAICKALHREGAKVAACDIKFPKSPGAGLRENSASELNLFCDVRDSESVAQTSARVFDNWGHIDILVNNAGVLGESSLPFEAYTPEKWDGVMATNLRSHFLMTQSVWPHMKRQGGGKIICLGSIAGRIGGVLAGPHYCASKGGIHAFVKWAAKRGTRHGIYVNGIAPGPIRTPMTANEPYEDEMVPLGRLGQPEDIAEVAVFLASQASNYITGSVIDVNGGIFMN